MSIQRLRLFIEMNRPTAVEIIQINSLIWIGKSITKNHLQIIKETEPLFNTHDRVTILNTIHYNVELHNKHKYNLLEPTYK